MARPICSARDLRPGERDGVECDGLARLTDGLGFGSGLFRRTTATRNSDHQCARQTRRHRTPLYELLFRHDVPPDGSLQSTLDVEMTNRVSRSRRGHIAIKVRCPLSLR